MLLTALHKVFPRKSGKQDLNFVCILKWTPLLFFMTFLSRVKAQEGSSKITLSEKNVSLKKVFTEISKQTGISVMYDESLIQSVGPVSINVKNALLKDVLRECLKDKPLEFKIEGNTVAIAKKKGAAVSVQEVQLEEVRTDLHGKVSDENGKPLEGVTVNVILNGSSNIFATGANGEFSIGGMPDRATIVFTSIGYETKEINYNHRNEFNVVLRKKVTQLGNVTVEVNNGYQILPRERTTGSFDIVDSALFNRSVSPNFLTHLDGVASGVNFDNRSEGSVKTYANQGRTPIFYIRGLSTINASNFPLVIVDGFPFISDNPYKQDVNNINPNDIESLTVLKDAAAASIWGARAGNGVVVITTKSGKYGQKPQVNFNNSVTVTGKPDLFSQRTLSTPDYISVERSLYAQGNYSSLVDPATALGKPVSQVVVLLDQASKGIISQADADAQIAALSKLDVRRDELDDFYQKGIDQQYNVTVRGGSPTNKYFISAGYDRGNAVDRSFQNRWTVTANNIFRPVSNLEITLPVTFSDAQKGSNHGDLNNLVGKWSPYTQFKDASGKPQNVVYGNGYNQTFIQTALNDGLYDMNFNPIDQFNAAQYNRSSTSLITITPDIRYSLKGFSVDVKYQYSRTTVVQNTYLSDSVWSVKDNINNYTQIESPGVLTYPLQQAGTLQTVNNTQVNNDIRATLGYNHNLGIDHRLDLLAGYERNESRITGSTNGWYGYNPNTGTVQSTVDYVTYFPMTNNILAGSPYNYSSTIYPMQSSLLQQFVAFISSFANAAYTFKNRYVLSGSARMDRANLFGVDANAKKKILWSAGASWRIDQEPFYKSDWLPLLKLRATYGFQGNVPSINYHSVATINYYPGTSNSSGLPYAILNNPPNPDLSWEKIGQANIGVDFGTKKDILAGTIEYYSKKGTDLIASYPVDPSTGENQRIANVGDLVGHGIDITLTSKNITTRNFKWTSRLLFSHNTDKLTKYFVTTSAYQIVAYQAGYSYPSSPTAVTGNAVYGIYSLKWAGLDATGSPQGYDSLGKVSTDYNQLTSYARMKDLVYSGSALPTYFGSFMNDFSYKGFTLSVNISYKAGYYFHAQSINYSSLFGYGNAVLYAPDGSSDFDKRWQKPGDEKHTNVPGMPTQANTNYLKDEFYQYSSVLVQKGDNIRLKDISLSYDFTSWFKATSPFSNVVLYGYYLGNTLLWKANKMGIDPDFPTMKPARSYSLGLRLGFK